LLLRAANILGRKAESTLAVAQRYGLQPHRHRRVPLARAALTQYLAENGQGFETAMNLARKIASHAPLSNFAVLHAMPRIAESQDEAGFFIEALMSAIASSDKDAKERLRAFLEKRAPKVVHSG
jgi:enoyl-CoA hydratase/carnithine racemase